MNFHLLKDKKIIEKHFRKNIHLNLYQLGDLDDFFFDYTKWFAVSDKNEIRHIALLYTGSDLPVLLALCDSDQDSMKLLLSNFKTNLPAKFYSHLSPGISETLASSFSITGHGKYFKMSLDKNDFKFQGEDPGIRRLDVGDLEQVKKFYAESYPDNWFDKRMIETGKYFGYFIDGKIRAVAGIHVYSPEYRIAVLGNITTHPDFRGKSLCTKVTSMLCRDLMETVDNIGLNVSFENIPAIKSYEKIGFKKTGEYEEYMFILDS